MSIYAELLQKADKGKRFKVDLKNKNLWLGSKQVISEGTVLIDENELINKDDLNGVLDLCMNINEDPWGVIKKLYQLFKHSVPNSKWKDNSYFKALPVEELTDSELAFNIDRKFAAAMLEGYILLGSIIGWITWQEEEHWFWQDNEFDKDLIILRQWII